MNISLKLINVEVLLSNEVEKIFSKKSLKD